MENKEDKKEKNSGDINNNKKGKRRYFRIEKDRHHASALREKESKKIFKTQKDDFSKRRALRDLKRLKFHKTKKFITIKKERSIFNSEKDNNSFVVKKIIPKKLKVIKGIKNNSNHINDFSKTNENLFFTGKKDFLSYLFQFEKHNGNTENNSNSGFRMNNNKLNSYKIKLMLVNFYSIRNLCKYINNFFYNIALTENKTIDEYVYQIYQSLQILDRKINDFKLFQNLKDDIKVSKEDFCDISSLKLNLLEMKKILNNSMSQNLLNIYLDIDNFCQIYSL